jgi:ferritin
MGDTMLHDRMQEALDRQINAEFASAYLYLSMSARFSDIGLPGGAGWMKVQYKEELVHAEMLFDHIVARGGSVHLQDIGAQRGDWDGAREMFESTLAHEKKVTGLIDALVDLATELKDHATVRFLDWYVAEQVEEEANATDMVQKCRLAGDTPAGLYQLDKDLAARVFTPPAPPAQ